MDAPCSHPSSKNPIFIYQRSVNIAQRKKDHTSKRTIDLNYIPHNQCSSWWSQQFFPIAPSIDIKKLTGTADDLSRRATRISQTAKGMRNGRGKRRGRAQGHWRHWCGNHDSSKPLLYFLSSFLPSSSFWTRLPTPRNDATAGYDTSAGIRWWLFRENGRGESEKITKRLLLLLLLRRPDTDTDTHGALSEPSPQVIGRIFLAGRKLWSFCILLCSSSADHASEFLVCPLVELESSNSPGAAVHSCDARHWPSSWGPRLLRSPNADPRSGRWVRWVLRRTRRQAPRFTLRLTVLCAPSGATLRIYSSSFFLVLNIEYWQ